MDRAADGAPMVTLQGPAAALGPAAIELSITHKHNVVAAVALRWSRRRARPQQERSERDGAPMSLADTHQEAEASAFLRVAHRPGGRPLRRRPGGRRAHPAALRRSRHGDHRTDGRGRRAAGRVRRRPLPRTGAAR
ncbi:hypothetical protein LT493_26455 [Streptomyces tricolor]|nr:hypothetical protein [Streptomyces tricolor]